jgi:rsbT antagonist protein RsbS
LPKTEVQIILQQYENHIVVPVPNLISDRYFMNLNKNILDVLSCTSIRGVILDISGVEIMDKSDFINMNKAIKNSQLMGVTVIVVGMQPSVAAALALLNVDDKWTRSTITVEHAIRILRC